MRRLCAAIAVMGPLVLMPAVPSMAQGGVRVEGDGSRSIEFTVAAPTTLSDPVEGRQPAGTTAGGYVGYYIQQLPELTPVAGFVTFPAFDVLFGIPAPISLVPGQRGVTLDPAMRYRLTLLADGPSTAIIPTSQGAGFTLRPAAPVKTFFTGVVDLPRTGVTTRAFTTELLPGSLVLQFAAEAHATAAIRGREMCVVPVGTTSCGSLSPPEPVVPGAGDPSGVVYGKLTPPGTLDAGRYDLLYRLLSVDPDGRYLVVGLVLDTAPTAVKATPPAALDPPGPSASRQPGELPASGGAVPFWLGAVLVLLALVLVRAGREREKEGDIGAPR